MAHAEVVHRDALAELAQLVQRVERRERVLHQHQFGDLEIEVARRNAGVRERAHHDRQQIVALSWAGDRLIETLMLSGQAAAVAQAVRMTHSPSGLMRPISSAGRE